MLSLLGFSLCFSRFLSSFQDGVWLLAELTCPLGLVTFHWGISALASVLSVSASLWHGLLATELLRCWDAAPPSSTFGHHAGSCYWWLRTLLLYLVIRAQSLGSLVPAPGLIGVIDSQSFHIPTFWGDRAIFSCILHTQHDCAGYREAALRPTGFCPSSAYTPHCMPWQM